jgi:cobalt/nickel transport system ATP-binding protein
VDVSTPLIELQSIAFSYGGRGVFQDMTLALHEGERVGIMGPIGSGKTTLLHLIVGLLKPSAGRLHAFGRVRAKEDDFHEVRRKAGLVFQDPDDQLFCPTVIEDVAFGPLNLGKGVEEAKDTARATLKRVGLAGFDDRITYKLSGGEKRLVALATVLAMDPEVLLLDEPTASLDKASVGRVAETLDRLPQSMLVVSHEPDFLSRVATRRVTLSGGRIRVEG